MKNGMTKLIIGACIAVPTVLYIANNFTEEQKNYLIASLVGTVTVLLIDEFSKFFEKGDK